MLEDRKPQEPASLTLFVWARALPSELVSEFIRARQADTLLQDYDPAALVGALADGKSCAAIWRHPSDMVAEALASGQPLAAALEDWQETARGLLAVFRRNRRQLVLLSEAALVSTDPETRAQLQHRLGLTGDFRLPAAGPGDEDVFGLLALLAVPQIDELRPLINELEASSLYCPHSLFDPIRLERAGRQLAQGIESQRLLAEQGHLDQQAREADLAEISRLTREAEDRNSELATRNAGLSSQLEAQVQQIAMLQQQNAALTADRDGQSRAVKTLESQLADRKKEAEQLGSQIAALTAERDRQSAEARTVQTRLDDRQKQAEQLGAQIAALTAERDRNAVETTLLRDQIRLMQEALDGDVAQQRDRKLAEMDELARNSERAVSKALADARTAAAARTRAETRLAEALTERDHLRREAEQLEETRAHVDRMAADLAALHAAVVARDTDLAAMRDERDRLRQDVEHLAETRARLDRMAADLAALQSRLGTRENELDEAQSLADALRSRAVQAEAELAEVSGERDRLRQVDGQLAETRAQLDGMAADMSALQAALKARESELDELRAATEALLASNSWKATAPLRRVSLMLGRHRS